MDEFRVMKWNFFPFSVVCGLCVYFLGGWVGGGGCSVCVCVCVCMCVCLRACVRACVCVCVCVGGGGGILSVHVYRH